MTYILTIGESGSSWPGRSPVSSTHATEAAARDALVAYVRRNRDSEIGPEVGGFDPPEDPTGMVEQYFAEVPETYDILENAA